MTTDTRLAFAHPEERAAAMAGPDPRDRISLRDHVVEVEIGAFQQERGARQRVRFDIVVEVRAHAAPLEDDVDRILSYDVLTEAIAAELAAERLNLLETLAERVAERVLRAPQAMRIFLRIEKLDRGPGDLGVEIVRSRRDGAGGATTPRAAVQPIVVHLDNAAIRAADLPARIDRWTGQGAPLVLTVGLPGEGVPQAGAPEPQRRIDLLAIAQNAWLLAARDPRCTVVETRTEIDWAIGHGQIIVWAPAKLVLDATDRPGPDPVALAEWLAALIGAQRLIVCGTAEPPAQSRVPVMRDPG
ncbi:dihydroneopterin aldolase [Halodurantibacterium flavum]|uniref:dihydroneopterin aldolase n=1 Tax=Halodurantibacterium flavum TaxID=1382802 RepID=A0ABW4S5C9_9RHOB